MGATTQVKSIKFGSLGPHDVDNKIWLDRVRQHRIFSGFRLKNGTAEVIRHVTPLRSQRALGFWKNESVGMSLVILNLQTCINRDD